MLDAGFAEDEDGAFGGGEVEDAGGVNCGAVGGAEDFVLFCLSIIGWLINWKERWLPRECNGMRGRV